MVKCTYGYDFNIDVEDLSLKADHVFEYLRPYNCIYLDSGRSCIKILCQLFAGRELLVPAFSCFSVIYGFTEGVKPVFYNVHEDLTIDFEDLEKKITAATAGIYVTNYFGHMISEEDAERLAGLKAQYGLIVVEDNTQSVFSGDLKIGDYAVASIRKWFPVPDGGVIYSKNSLATLDIRGLRRESKQIRKLYPQIMKSMLLREVIDFPAAQIAEMFAEVERELDAYSDNGEIFLMNEFTEFIYRCNSVGDMIKKRQENEKYLRACLNSPYLRPVLPKLNEGECPLNLPMYCTCRDQMRDYLVETCSIYPSVLWRTHRYDPVNGIGNIAEMGRQIMSFPIDQRYDKEDMDFLAEAINEFRL